MYEKGKESMHVWISEKDATEILIYQVCNNKLKNMY